MVFSQSKFKKLGLASFTVMTVAFSSIQAQAAFQATDLIQAEKYSSMRGIKTGGGAIGSLDNGDYAMYSSVDFGSGVDKMTLNIGVPAQYAGQQIEARIDSLNGTKLGSLTVQSTGGFMIFKPQEMKINSVSGIHNLYLIARGAYGAGNIDSFRFSAASATPASTVSGMPDLVVTSISTNPAQPVDGQPFTYSAKITNVGTASTPAGVILGVSFNTDGSRDLWSDTFTGSLAPGASVVLTTNNGDAGSASLQLSSGAHSVRAHVNDLLRFQESRTDNNTKDFSYTVGAVSSPSPSPTPAPAPAPMPAPVPAPAPAPTAAGPYGQDSSLYTLTFEDEFNGTSLDTSKWKDHIWYDAPSATNDYGVANGSLKIWPQRNSQGQFAERILVTDGKFYQTYGYFEMEAKLPIGAGCWPAFWLLNSDDPDHGEPEIDIMEAYSGDTTGYWADSNLHPTRFAGTYFQNGANQSGLQQSYPLATSDLSAAFHKYAVKWEPGRVTFYFDGKPYASANVTMTKRMYILLDMQYGSASGPADNTTPTGPGNSFEVKYVRAWQLK